jgi:hypothetical protein
VALMLEAMSTEDQVSTGAETQSQAPVVEKPEVTTPEVERVTPPAEEPAKEDDAEKSLKRMARRIDKVTAARYQAEARAMELERQLAKYQEQSQQTEVVDKAPDPYELAKQIAKVERITERSNAVFASGVKTYGDEVFKEALSEVIAEAGPLAYPKGHAKANQLTPLGEAIIDSDAPEKLIHYLGKHPDVAESLQGLTDAQLGRRIARIESEMTKTTEAKPSNAPKPLTPVKGSAASDKDPSEMSYAEFCAYRRRQIAQRR